MPWYLGNSRILQLHDFPFGVGALVVWSGMWTALCLWHAARRNELGWFLWFLLVHTAGLVELWYLVFVAKVFSSTEKKRRKK